MARTLKDSIAEAVAAWQALPSQELINDGGRGFTHEEMHIFGVTLEQIPRLMAAWDAWFEFLGLVVSGNSHDDALLAAARQHHPELTAGNEPELWSEFAKIYADVSSRQAEAMYWKDWFWTVRACSVVYADERH